MSDNVNIVIEAQDQIYGSMAYTVSVKLINGSNNDLESITVDPNLIPGRLVSFSEKATEEIEVDELESQKRRLIDELETQIDKAFMKYRLRDMTFAQKFDLAMTELVNGYVSLFTLGKQPKSYPVWALKRP